MISMLGMREYVLRANVSEFLLTPLQDALVQAVADANENTIVCVNTVGPIIVEKWIDHPNGTHSLSVGPTKADYIL